MPAFKILDVNALNVDQLGFSCALCQPGVTGYQEKLEWAKERFSEGLRIKIIQSGGRGFIEYMPGKMAWRGIDAPAYMVIHCMWVEVKAKGKGLGKALLDACMHDARQTGMRGVAVVSASHQDGFVDTEFFLSRGFHVIQSEGGIDLCALKFDLAAADPYFAPDLRKKAKALGHELTVVSSPQCPFTYAAAEQVLELAHANHIPARSLRVNSLAQLRHTSPSPYASFDVAYDGEVISHLCQCMTAGKLRDLVDKTARKP